MSEEYRTEEEQVEALRRWWDENGRSTMAAIVVALALGFGWQGWQDHNREKSETASVIYQDLLVALNPGSQAQLDEEQKTTARHLAERLKIEYTDLTYGQFAALHLAKLAVETNDLATAEAELRWILTETTPEGDVRWITQLRLARIQTAGGDAEQALQVLQVDEGNPYRAAYAIARGDAYMQLGQQTAARESYEFARELNAASGDRVGVNHLDMKVQSLNPVPARELVSEVSEG